MPWLAVIASSFGVSGGFSVRFREASEGRNPRTGEPVTVDRKGFPSRQEEKWGGG
jgi:nucleoid DNA-binding protein